MTARAGAGASRTTYEQQVGVDRSVRKQASEDLVVRVVLAAAAAVRNGRGAATAAIGQRYGSPA